MRLPVLLVCAWLALLAGPALARPDFPAKLDAACRAGGRTPPNPAELARASGVAYADCALCHTFSNGGFPTAGNVNAAGNSYKRGNIDPFCVVQVVNHPPVLAPIGNQAVNVGQPLGLMLSATDLDNDRLAFSATGVPTGAVFMDAGNGMATFNWTPTQAGNTAVTFTVTDGMATDSERVVITAGSVNAPPVLAPIGNQTVTVGQMLVVAISATDPEGGAVHFTATGLPTGATLQDFANGTAEIDYTPSMAGQASVTVTATDMGTPPESSSETFLIVAQPVGTTEGPSLDFAGWNTWTGELAGMGHGADAGSQVTVVDANTGGALAVTRAGSDGSFDFVAKTFLAPCTVRARNANGVLGMQTGVLTAPKDCGTQLLTRAKPQWSCKLGKVNVRGSRAPMSSDLTLVDAATGATLATGQSDARGRFELNGTSRFGPANVRVRMSSGTGAWTLGPIPVRNAGIMCEVKTHDN